MLTSSSTFAIADAATAQASVTLQVLPALAAPAGHGRLVHPTLGAFDYELKPDEWTNLDASGVIIPPIWNSVRTLGGAANRLWSGKLRDVVVEERWTSPEGLSMPVSQLRMLLAIWTNPVDPAVGYVQWYPNYVTDKAYNVIVQDLSAGGQGNIVFDDLIHALEMNGTPAGWMTNPVTMQLRIVSEV